MTANRHLAFLLHTSPIKLRGQNLIHDLNAREHRQGDGRCWQAALNKAESHDLPLHLEQSNRLSLWAVRRIDPQEPNAAPLYLALAHIPAAPLDEIKHLRSVTEALQRIREMVMVTDAEANIVYVNRTFEKLTGYAANDVIGHRPTRFVSLPEDPEAFRSGVSSLRSGDEIEVQLCLQTRHNALLEVSAVITPFAQQPGSITHYLCVSRDISRERDLQRQLQQVQRSEALGQLTSGVAHRFNNVLANIVAHTEMLRIETNSKEHPKIEHRAEGILESAAAGRQLVSQIRSFYKTNTDPTRRPLSIVQLLRNAINFINNVRPHNVEIEADIEETDARVLAVSEEVHQVLINFMTNAFEAMSDKRNGHLVIQLSTTEKLLRESLPDRPSRPEACVRIAIVDNGRGMDDETERRAFEPFFTTKKTTEASGMGLPVARATVSRYGGRIRLLSAPGQGTTAEILLPIVRSEVPDRDQLLGPRGRGERILLADSQHFILEAGSNLLQEQGYEVTTASTVDDAMRLLGEQEFDLLISDVSMPQEEPLGLISRLRHYNRNLPVLVTAKLDSIPPSWQTEALHITRVLPKPCPARQITEAVRDCLGEQ